MPRRNENAGRGQGKVFETKQKGHKPGSGRSGAMKAKRKANSQQPRKSGKKRAA